MGKSSLLAALCRQTRQSQDGSHILALIDVAEQTYQTYQDFLVFICKQFMEQNPQAISISDTSIGGETTDFKQFLDEIKDQGFHPVLLLDEFETITTYSQFEENFFYFLRSQANQGKISYITATKDTLNRVARDDLIGSPFFNIFGTYHLGPLQPDEALDLISTPAERAGYPFARQEIDWILRLAGRHPFFIQRSCYFLFEKTCQQTTPLNTTELDEITQQIYLELHPHFQHAWKHLDTLQQEQLAWEARHDTANKRNLPEFSESLLFRQFVRQECSISPAELTIGELEELLNNIDDIKRLAKSTPAYWNSIYAQMKGTHALPVERGLLVQNLLLSTIEELRPSNAHQDDTQLRMYHILRWRHKERLKNEEIAARLAISGRHFFRERNRALNQLYNLLLHKEMHTGRE
jgi:hypothetical protein